MIQTVLMIARIASQRHRLRRRYAHARAHTPLRTRHRGPALQTNDCNLAPALSVTLDGPVCARSTHLAF
jgi:hypothetical protein